MYIIRCPNVNSDIKTLILRRDEMNRSTSFAVSVICIVSTAFLVLFSGILPVCSVLFMMLASVVSAYCFLRGGIVATIINIVVSSLLSLLIGGFHPVMLIIPLMGIAPGIISGVLISRKADYYVRLLWTASGFLIVYLFSMYLSGIVMNGGFSGMFDEMGDSAKIMLNQILSGEASVKTEEANAFVDSVVHFSKMVFPSILILFSAVIGYVHVVLLNLFIRKFGGSKADYVCFDSHCAPKSMSYIYFAASVIIMFAAETGAISVVLNNIVMILDTILAFCGLSFIEYKFKVNLKYGFVRWFIYVVAILVTSNIAIQLLSVIGMIDSFYDFRKVKRLGE